jgi:phage gp36-like protein
LQETTVSDVRKADQASVDAALTGAIKKVDMLEAYLKAKFTLTKGTLPHTMKF